MKESVFDLAYYYYKNFYSNQPELKKQLIIDLASLLNGGWTIKELKGFMQQHLNKKFNIVNYVADKDPSQRNLINPLKFYYHAELRVTSPPPKIDIDYDSGEITKTVEDFFLEPVGSYTMEDLILYFLSKDKLFYPQTYNKKRLIGALNYLLSKYSVQELLYTMDVAQQHLEGYDMAPLSQPLEIEVFVPKAKDAIDSKRTESKLNGDDKIVYRRRL